MFELEYWNFDILFFLLLIKIKKCFCDPASLSSPEQKMFLIWRMLNGDLPPQHSSLIHEKNPQKSIKYCDLNACKKYRDQNTSFVCARK